MRNILVLVLIACTILPLAAAPAAAKPQPANVAGAIMDRTVEMDIKDTPLEQALGMLLKPAGVSYRVDPEVANLKVTAVLKGISADVALQEVLKAAGATMKTENGVLHVMARQPASSTLATELERKLVELTAQLAVELRNKKEEHADVQNLRAQIKVLEERLALELELTAQRPIDAGSPRPTISGQASRTQVFPIEYINPAELVPLVYTLGARQVTVVSGGKLVVNGTDEIIAEAEGIIRRLDTEEALPRPVRIQVAVLYKIIDGAGEKSSSDASADGTVADGQPVSLNAHARIQTGNSTKTMLAVSDLTPAIGSDNRITLTGKVGIFTTERGVRLTSEAESPVAVTVASGKESIISSGTFPPPDADGKVGYEIVVTATIGEGRLRSNTNVGGGMGRSGDSMRRW